MSDITTETEVVSTPLGNVTVTRQRVSVEDGLKILGCKFSPSGVVKADVLVRCGLANSKRYAIRRRAGDGHTLYRWGRLVSAEVTTFSDSPYRYVVFIPERTAP